MFIICDEYKKILVDFRLAVRSGIILLELPAEEARLYEACNPTDKIGAFLILIGQYPLDRDFLAG